MSSCRYTYICVNLLLFFSPLLSSPLLPTMSLYSTPLHSTLFHFIPGYPILSYPTYSICLWCMYICMYVFSISMLMWPTTSIWWTPLMRCILKRIKGLSLYQWFSTGWGVIWQYTRYRDVWEGNKWHLVDRSQGCCKTACNAQGSPAAENYLARNSALFLALLYFHSSEHDFSGWAPWDLGSSISGSGGKSWGEW